VDHGCTQTLEELTGSLTRYPVIPIIINSVAPPFGPYRRVRKLGEAVGKFLATLNKRVLILGTGGLSHEPPVPLLSGAPDEIANFLIAGRNPTPEARAARQARTVAAGKIYGTDACAQTPLNEEWDLAFIDLLTSRRLAEVDDFRIDEISKAAGRSTHEVRTWVAAFAALAATGPYAARKDYYRAINEWIAGYGVVSAEQA
jgi:2,3-dihydroxyphenylpropionate 1,2-dioxygenase